jgi:hypothetical protein
VDLSIFHDLSQFGGLGIVIAFLIWKDIHTDKVRENLEERRLEQEKLMEERRLDFDKNRLEMDKELSSSLASLTGAVTSIQNRLR